MYSFLRWKLEERRSFRGSFFADSMVDKKSRYSKGKEKRTGHCLKLVTITWVAGCRLSILDGWKGIAAWYRQQNHGPTRNNHETFYPLSRKGGSFWRKSGRLRFAAVPRAMLYFLRVGIELGVGIGQNKIE